MGNDVPWFVAEIPTLFVSLGSPYHLQDVPMIKTFINAYGANDETIDLVFEKLAGLSKFSGTSPVDPSCGREDALF
jgi:beta-N-acetylhexosaminidase